MRRAYVVPRPGNPARVARSCWIAAVVLSLPEPATAQSIRGSVTDDRGTPVAGVLVQLLDARLSTVAKSLSNERGEYRLRAASAGSYRVRTQRIGFRPTSYGPFALGDDVELVRHLSLTGLPVALATVSVVDRNPCSTLSDSSTTTYLVWEQVRTALVAADIGAAPRGVVTTTIAYERVLDPSARSIREQSASIRSGYMRQPWRAVSLDSLREIGYLVTDRDGVVNYHAPDLGVLLSDAFLEDHCFRLAPSTDPQRIGISFEPSPSRRRIPGVRGTLWIDRESSQLRNMEFGYVNAPRERIENAGGEMEFVRLSSGAWVIAGWAIRMPILELKTAQPGRAGGARMPQIEVAGLKVTGGRLVLIRQGADTLWMRPPLRFTGVIRDSVSGAPIRNARVALVGTSTSALTDANGRFRTGEVIPGAHTIEVRSPSLDSIGAAHRSSITVLDSTDVAEIRIPAGNEIVSLLCGRVAGEPVAMLAGLAGIPGDSVRPRDARVVVEWADRAPEGRTSRDTGPRMRSLEVRTDVHGMYRICGVPVDLPLTVFAQTDTRRSRPVVVRIPARRLMGHVPLTLDLPRDTAGSFAGIVLDDSTRRPLENAEVSMPDLSKTVLTDERGRFALAGISPGLHRIVVRRIGYRSLETRVTFAADRTTERRIVLTPVTTLESVVVVAERDALPDFEEHRRGGLGQFLTREDLARQKGRRLSDVLTQVSGVRIVPGVANRAWVATNRGPRSLRNIPLVDPSDATRGADRQTCYALVYMDGALMYAGKDEEPLFDVNTISPDQIDAIEYYAGPAQTPLRYSVLGSPCGVLVIHTRRTP